MNRRILPGRKDAPCMGCGEREVGCHGRCERYREFEQERQAEYEKRLKKSQEHAICGALTPTHERQCKRLAAARRHSIR